MPQINLKHAETFAEALDHPEGVALGPDGKIYAGGEAGQVYRIDYESRQVETYADTEGLNLGLALDAAAKTARWKTVSHPSSDELFSHLKKHAGGGRPRTRGSCYGARRPGTCPAPAPSRPGSWPTTSTC